MMLRTSSPAAADRRTRLSLCTFLSVAALSCGADGPDSQVDAPQGSRQDLTQGDLIVTPVEGDVTRVRLDVVGADRTEPGGDGDAPSGDAPGDDSPADDAPPSSGAPSPGAPSGPRVVDVNRTDVSNGDDSAPPSSGPRIIGVTRTEHTGGGAQPETPSKAEGEHDGPVVVKRGEDATTITVEGFPTITLTTAENGDIVVSMPGSPPFTIPKGTVLEAPGGIRIEG